MPGLYRRSFSRPHSGVSAAQSRLSPRHPLLRGRHARRHRIDSAHRRPATAGRADRGHRPAARHARLHHHCARFCRRRYGARFCTPFASSACAFTNSSTATMCITRFNPRWPLRGGPRKLLGISMNFYSIRHLTRFRYSQPISESIMETRMHPRSDSNQHCLTFSLSVSPRCRVFSYRDHLGNNVQHFDIPGEHNQLVIVAESVVEQQVLPDVPGFLSPDAWERAGRADRRGRLLGDAAAQHLCRGNAGADSAGQADGRYPPRRSADAGAGAESAALRLLRIRAALHARRLAHRRSHRQRQGRLPGLCPHHDCPVCAT